MLGLEKLFAKKVEEPEKRDTYKLLNEIVKRIHDEKSYDELKQKVLELSNEWNKELLFEDFENKIRVFISYDEEGQSFPLNPWVDNFFEN